MNDLEQAKKEFFKGIELFEAKEFKIAFEKFQLVLKTNPDHAPSIENALLCCANLTPNYSKLAKHLYLSTPNNLRTWAMLKNVTLATQTKQEAHFLLQEFQYLIAEVDFDLTFSNEVFGLIMNLKFPETYDNPKQTVSDAIIIERALSTLELYFANNKFDPNKQGPTLQKATSFLISAIKQNEQLKYANRITELAHRSQNFEIAKSLFELSIKKSDKIVLSKNSLTLIADAVSQLSDLNGLETMASFLNCNPMMATPETLFNCAKGFDRIRMHERALEILTTLATSRGQLNNEIYIEIAKQATLSDNIEKAKYLLESLCESTMRDPVIQGTLMNLYLFSSDLEKAETLCLARLNKDSLNVQANAALADIYNRKHQFEKAFFHLAIATTTTIPATKIGKLDHSILVGNEGLGDQIAISTILRKLLDRKDVPPIIFHPKLEKALNLEKSNRPPNNENFRRASIPLSTAPYFAIRSNGFSEDTASKLTTICDEDLMAWSDRLEQLRKASTIVIALGSTAPTIGDKKSINWAFALRLLPQNSIAICIDYRSESINEAKRLMLNDSRIRFLENIDTFEDVDKIADVIRSCDFGIFGSNTYAHLCGHLKTPAIVLTTKGFGQIWYWQKPYVNQNSQSTIYPTVSVMTENQLRPFLASKQ